MHQVISIETALSLPLVITFSPPFPLSRLTADVLVACVGYFMITVNYTITGTTTIIPTTTTTASTLEFLPVKKYCAVGQWPEQKGQFVPGNWQIDLLTARLHTLQHSLLSRLNCEWW